MQQQTQFDSLIEALITGAISAGQRRTLNELLADATHADLLKSRLEQELASGRFTPAEEQDIEQWLEARIQSGVFRKINEQPQIPLHPVHFLKRYRWAAAAVFIGIMAAGGWYFLRDKQIAEPIIAKADVKAPATNRAMITLASGKTVYLDQITNGQLATEGDVKIVKLADGQIAYSGTATEVQYNTLTNPRGSKVIDMVLSDGSHIWLNAGSSITYPVAFNSKERNVSIKGEAYFEIQKETARFFTVSKADMKVTVLGTHFNVSAYDDEPEIKVTLLEGSVKVNKASLQQIIKPGQQAIVKDDIKVDNDIDTEEVMAWKNGKFLFGEKTDVTNIMRQVARWYDVSVEYKGNVNTHIGGSVSRDVNVSALLSKLEMTGGVHFEMKGNKIIVSQ